MLISPPRRRRTRASEQFNGTALGGRWSTVDTASKVSVTGGQVAVAGGKATPAWNDPAFTYTARSWLPKAGLAFETEITWTAFGSNGCEFGFDTDNPVSDAMRPAFQVFAGGVLRAIQAQTPIARQNTPVTLATGVPYRFRIRLLDPAYGVLWSFSADRGKTWAALFVDSQWPTVGTPLFMGSANNDATYTVEYMAADYIGIVGPALSDTLAARTAPGRADSGQPWVGVSGKAIPVIAGDLRIPAGSTESWLVGWDGIADGVWEGDLNFGSAPSTQKAAYVTLRHRDSTNYVRVTFSRVNQVINVIRLANNVSVTDATLSSAGFADNTTYHVTLAAYGDVLVVYQDGVERLRTSESFGKFFGQMSAYLNDNLATPDIRWDNVRAWGFPARPLLMDSFDRPDAASLGPADTGQAYTLTNDVGGIPTAGIESGRARLTGFGDGFGNQRLVQAALGRPAYVAAFTLRATDFSAQNTYAGCVLRWVDYQNYVAVRAIFHPTPASCNISVMKNVGGAQSVVLSTGWTPVALQDYQFVVVLIGNTVEVYRDGARILTTTVTDHATAPAGGPLFGGSTLNSRVDDIRYLPLGTALAHDTFTRVDSAITPGNSELHGTPWTVLLGGTWGINSAQLYNQDATAATVRAVGLPVPIQDLDVTLDVVRQNGTTGIILRSAATGTDYLAATFDGTSLILKERVASGAEATLKTTAYAWTAGATARTIRCRLFGGVLAVYANETLIDSVAYSGHAGASEIYHGAYTVQAVNTNRWDNLKIAEVVA